MSTQIHEHTSTCMCIHTRQCVERKLGTTYELIHHHSLSFATARVKRESMIMHYAIQFKITLWKVEVQGITFKVWRCKVQSQKRTPHLPFPLTKQPYDAVRSTCSQYFPVMVVAQGGDNRRFLPTPNRQHALCAPNQPRPLK